MQWTCHLESWYQRSGPKGLKPEGRVADLCGFYDIVSVSVCARNEGVPQS